MPSVYCVDDELFIQDLYMHMLPVGGFDVVGCAYNGKEAVTTYPTLKPRPDIVVMDQRMPIMSGVEATKRIMDIDPKACIIVISADATARDKATEAGARAFVQKPFEMRELFSLLQGSLHR